MKSTLKKVHKKYKANSIAIFKGHQVHRTVIDSDLTADWVPDWNFFYLFGMKDETSECYTVLDFASMKVYLFIHEKTEEEIIFEGGVTLGDDP